MMDPKVEAEYEEYKAAGRIWGVIDKENIKKIKFPRVPKEIVDGFKALEDDLTGTVSDILDALGYNKVIPANVLPPIEPGHLIVGTAVTLRSIPIERTTTLSKWPPGRSTIWPSPATCWWATPAA